MVSPRVKQSLDGAVAGAIMGSLMGEVVTGKDENQSTVPNMVKWAAVGAASEALTHNKSLYVKVNVGTILGGVTNVIMYGTGLYDAQAVELEGTSQGAIVGAVMGAVTAGASVLLRQARNRTPLADSK